MVGDKLINPIVGVCIPNISQYKDSPFLIQYKDHPIVGMTIPQIKRDNLCPWSQELHLDEKLEITSLVSRQFYLLNGKTAA